MVIIVEVAVVVDVVIVVVMVMVLVTEEINREIKRCLCTGKTQPLDTRGAHRQMENTSLSNEVGA